jgi:hypothetical protein
MKPVAWTCLLFFGTTWPGIAQKIKPDTAFLTTAVRFTESLYTKQLRGESLLHNGTEYREYVSTHDEHPYFLSDDWIEGSVIYQNERYEKIPLQLDISTDKLITEHTTSGKKIQLINDKLTAFTIGHHRFIKLEARLADTLNLAPGFYETLVEGPHVTLLARHLKSLQRRTAANEIRGEFEEVNRYFFLVSEKYQPVKSKKSALRLLADKRAQLKQYLKKTKLRFGSSRESTLIELAKLYNTIKKSE